jgi:alpha-amylase
MAQGVNVLNVLTRRHEAYHKRLREFLAHGGSGQSEGVQTIHDLVKVKEKNLDAYLHYDWHRRVSLLDHFLHPATTIEGFKESKYGEQGDFVLGVYQAEASGRSILLSRTGTVWSDNRPFTVDVAKRIFVGGTGLAAAYTLTNRGDVSLPVKFAPEFSFAFSHDDEAASKVLVGVDEWSRHDEGFGFTVTLKFSRKVDLWVFPLETVSLSEAGFERTYQGTVLLPVLRADIPAGESAALGIDIHIA